MILRSTIDAVQETARIEEVVGDYLKLKRRGSNLIGNCPFHNEKTPSFVVSPSKNLYKCFGCGKAGHPIQFVMDHDNVSFPDAIRQLAAKYNITIETEQLSEEQVSQTLRLDSLYLINQFAADYFRSQMWETDYGRSIGLQYIKERGFREETIKKFQIGYAPASRNGFLQVAKTKKYETELLISLGLTNKEGDRDFFQDRLIFPIQGANGKIIGFAGRRISKSESSPKYINSPETEIYQKSKVLYGIHQALASIRKLDLAYVVEGYTDVMALHEAGITNVVATSGTALTEDHIQILKRHTQNLHFIFDGDKAGIKAALRGMDMVLAQGINLKLVLLPEGEDPDSFSRKQSYEYLSEFLQSNSTDFILFKSGLLKEEARHDPLKKVEMIKSLVNSIAKIPDPIKRAVYIKECSGLTEIDESTLTGETNKVIKSDLYQKRKNQELDKRLNERIEAVETSLNEHIDIPSTIESRDVYQERDLVRALLIHGNKLFDPEQKLKISDYIIQNIVSEIPLIEMAYCKSIIEDYIKKEATIDIDYYLYGSNLEKRNFVIDMITSPFEYSENWELKKEIFLQNQPKPEENHVRDSHQALLRFKVKKVGRMLEENKAMIKLQIFDNNESELQIGLKVQKELIKIRNEILKELGTVVLA